MSHESGPSHVQQKHADTVEVTKGIRSEHQLTELLEKESGARSAKISQETATFTFHFVRVGGGASVTRGRPWAISRKQQGTAVRVDPQIEAEALFSTHGLMRIGDEEAKTNREEFDAIRKATGLVWRQFMLDAFDRAVSAETAILYARPRTLLAKFERLPADAWPLLKVMDWQNGVAFAPDGTAYWSI